MRNLLHYWSAVQHQSRNTYSFSFIYSIILLCFRTRKQYGEEVKKRISQKKEEIFQKKVEEVEAKRTMDKEKEQQRKEEEER